MAESDLEAAFLFHLRTLAPALEQCAAREYRFHPRRRWRFDFAWPPERVALECDGGQWAPRGGRHNTDQDREKLNEAARLGWRVLRFSSAMLSQDPAGCMDVLREALAVEMNSAGGGNIHGRGGSAWKNGMPPCWPGSSC
jgi:very-short-patch-repair endonuclease